MKTRLALVVIALLLVTVLLMVGCQEEEPALQGRVREDWVITKKLTVQEGGAEIQSSLTMDDVLDMNGKKIDLDVDADTSITADTDDQVDVEIGGADELVITASTMDVADMLIDQDIDVENLGGLPTIDSASVITTSTDGALWTVGASEIWFVYAVYCEVTTNFDCTGDDCTLIIGDGNDTDGFLVLNDAEMQTTDAEFTGAPAGWKGLHTDSMGAYLSGLAPFVYDGTDTIDVDVGGTDPAAGEATCYVVYQRVQ